jgi:hypothetical protein
VKAQLRRDTIRPISSCSIHSSIPRSFTCRSCRTSLTLRTGAQGRRFCLKWRREKCSHRRCLWQQSRFSRGEKGSLESVAILRGTNGSNLSPSSGESVSLPELLSRVGILFYETGFGRLEGICRQSLRFARRSTARLPFHGKTIIQRTSAGTQGIVAANRAQRLYATSWSQQRRPSARFSRVHPIRSPSSEWAIMG